MRLSDEAVRWGCESGSWGIPLLLHLSHFFGEDDVIK